VPPELQGEQRSTIQKRGCALQITANICVAQKAFQTKIDALALPSTRSDRGCG